jgi:two-component system KDP operon response regulator KdpE
VNAASVLIVEDESQIRRFIRTALEGDGCTVREAASGAAALALAAENNPELVILDLGLPDRDGVEVIRDLRAWSHVPVIILSARAAEDGKIEALDAGADDYLTKPFAVGELLARARALLRRARGSEAPLVRFGDIDIDFSLRTITRAGEPLHLTPTEYRLLAVLVANAGRVLTHRYLLKHVWGPDCVESNHYLRIYVASLRRKIESDVAQPQHILTEAGVGYRFANER